MGTLIFILISVAVAAVIFLYSWYSKSSGKELPPPTIIKSNIDAIRARTRSEPHRAEDKEPSEHRRHD